MSSPVKVVITGDENVGKSCILQRIKNNTFIDMYIATIGVDFGNVDINKNHLQIWDTAGQERFSMNRQSYYTGADVVLYVYDVTNKESLINVDKYITECHRSSPLNVVQYLVGTKSDKTNRVVTQSDVDALLTTFNLTLKGHFEVSSKSGESVQNMFNKIVESYVKTPVVQTPVKPETTLVDELLVELSELSKKVDSITERLKSLKV
jgi:small GTP-binding protein